MNGQTLTITSLVLSIIAVIAGVYAVIAAGPARAWRKQFSDGNLPENAGQAIAALAAKVQGLENGQEMGSANLSRLEELLGQSIQHVGLIRYNSLADEGGNLSFSLALLDAHHSGVVITSLHGRQQSRTYAKHINEAESATTLSDEEQNAIFDALKRARQKQKSKNGKTNQQNH